MDINVVLRLLETKLPPRIADSLAKKQQQFVFLVNKNII